MQNLLAAPGMGAMIPMNQSLVGANGTIQIPTQTLMNSNGTLQPSFVTLNQPTGPTFQIQNQNNGTTQLFHQAHQAQPQFQLQMPSAINMNPTGQLVNGPNGQQFLINQTIGNTAHTNMMTNQPQSQPIYQFVLPNGQVIQTVQPTNLNNTTTLISPQLVHQQNSNVQPPTAITVPIQTNQTGQTMNILTAPNLTLAQGQATTFITQPNGSNLQTSNSSTIIASHQSPNLHGQQNGLVITTPSSNSVNQPLILNTSPQMHQQASNQSLLIPAVSTATNQSGQQSNNTTTTAMVVLTQSNNSSIPNAVLDQKSLKQASPHQTVVLLTSPKMKNSPSHALIANKVVVNTSMSTISDPSKQNLGIGFAAPSCNTKVVMSPVTKPKPIPCDQSTQCDEHPQITKMLESIAEEDESQSSEKTQEDQTSGTSPFEPERPSRPWSTSSCGSLRIAEDEVEEEMEREDNDTENNDAFSTETELDNNSVNECENEQNGSSESEMVTNQATISATNTIATKERAKGQSVDDKEGYQSSYGSPCHFTDTEDEEEEECNLANGEVIDGEQEIKLVHKNGLTKAAYDLINNRLMGSDIGEDHATNDSKSSFTSGGVGRDDEDEQSNDSNAFSSLQTPSPAGSNLSAQMEPESTTQSWAAIKGKLYIFAKFVFNCFLFCAYRKNHYKYKRPKIQRNRLETYSWFCQKFQNVSTGSWTDTITSVPRFDAKNRRSIV